MRILIAGAAGFLGSHLAEKLIALGHNVIGIDDISTGRLVNLDCVINHERFEFINHDVGNPLDIKIDAILNFACPASPIHYQSDPVKTIETNFLGVINLLHLAKNQEILLLQASTSEIYGDPTISPQHEAYWGNVNPIGIRSCYDEGKRAEETLCFDYKRQYSVDTRVIRIFNTYGPNMALHDGRVVSNFIVQALQGHDITIYGDGSQTRSFCYVDDLIEGILKVLFLKNPIGAPINLGNPIEFSMHQLAEQVIALTGSDSRIVFENLPQDDPKQRKPDISRAKEILGWEPGTQLNEGLAKTIEYFRGELSR
jgi:UDP-glucuronate decarboxylase